MQDTEKRNDNAVIRIPKASRAFLVGETGTGKSTLAEILALEYLKEYPTARMLVVDTKPRFNAERELNGFTTKQSGRYKKWGIGSDAFKNSIAIPGKDSVKRELDQVWRLHSRIAIVHTERESEWGYAAHVVTEFYERYGATIPRLVFVDELADFYQHRVNSDIFQRIARNGRERNCSMIAASQRPRKIPVEVITEMKRLYMFHLSYKEDIKHVQEFGIPAMNMPESHVFYMYDKEMKLEFPSNAYHVLNIKKE